MSRFGGSRKPSSSRGASKSSSARGRSSKRNSDKDSGSQFQNVGSLTTTKDTSKSLVKELRESDDIKLWWRVYLPKGVESLTLEHEDMVFIQLGRFHEDAPDFVVGTVSLPPEE